MVMTTCNTLFDTSENKQQKGKPKNHTPKHFQGDIERMANPEMVFEQISQVQKYRERMKKVRARKRVERKSSIGVFNVVNLETRECWDCVDNLTKFAKDHFFEFGYRDYKTLYSTLYKAIVNETKKWLVKRI